jgi:hypothetical protein
MVRVPRVKTYCQLHSSKNVKFLLVDHISQFCWPCWVFSGPRGGADGEFTSVQLQDGVWQAIMTGKWKNKASLTLGCDARGIISMLEGRFILRD